VVFVEDPLPKHCEPERVPDEQMYSGDATVELV
jgi:hypothetical protein